MKREDILSPLGRRGWSRQYLRNCINDDVYLSHSFEEVSTLVSPEVVTSLDPSSNYGVWWYGKERHAYAQRREIAPDHTTLYKKTKKSTPAPREEWVAVPVPDAGIPREWVFAAREAIKENEWSSNACDNAWELTGGVIRCAEYGSTMSVNYIRARGRGYYRFMGRYNGGVEKRCTMSRTVRAEEAGARVWEFVTEILTNPHRLAQGLEKMLENERQPPAVNADEGSWVRRINELTVKQERLLDLHLDGDITTRQFHTKTAELEGARAAAEDQLEAARSRLARLEDIERGKDALIPHYASLVPQGLAELSA